jgi:hypothetical protein
MALWLVALLVAKRVVLVAGLRGPLGRERACFRPCVGRKARLALGVGSVVVVGVLRSVLGGSGEEVVVVCSGDSRVYKGNFGNTMDRIVFASSRLCSLAYNGA